MQHNILSMHKVREVLKYKFLSTFSHREIGRRVGVGHQTVGRMYKRALAAGLKWSIIKQLDDDGLTAQLFPHYPFRKSNLIRPNCADIYRELNNQPHSKGKKKKEDFWHEFFVLYGSAGVGRTTFHNDLRAFDVNSDYSMTQFKAPGDYFFCDIAGPKVFIGRNKDIPVSLFAGSFGYSDFISMQGFTDESQTSWLSFMESVFICAGGVPVFVVTDNAAALRTSRINQQKFTAQYLMFSDHYDFIPFDIPIRSPRYNYRAERAVRKYVDNILKDARELTFLDLNDFNKWLQHKIDDINNKVSPVTGDTAKQRFVEREQSALRDLNDKQYLMPIETHVITVQKDYKFVFEGGHYSIPHELKGQKVKVVITKNEVEMRCKNKTVCIHTRLKHGERNSMKPEHMPQNHKVLVEQNKDYFLGWAKIIDESVVTLMEAQFKGAGEPDFKGRAACLKIKSLAKKGELHKYIETCRWLVSLGRLTATAFEDALKANITNSEGLQIAYKLYQQQIPHNPSGGSQHVH